MTKNALLKLHYYWKPQIFYKDQVIYQQGQTCNKVYLIKSGEFEQYFDVEPLEDGKVKTHTFTGPTKQNVKMLNNSLKVER